MYTYFSIAKIKRNYEAIDRYQHPFKKIITAAELLRMG